MFSYQQLFFLFTEGFFCVFVRWGENIDEIFWLCCEITEVEYF